MNPRDERATSLPRRQRIPIELVLALVGTAAMLALSLAGCNVPAKIAGETGAAAVDAHQGGGGGGSGGSGSNAGSDAGTTQSDASPTPPPADAPPASIDAPPPPPPIDAPLPPPADAAVDAT